MVIRISQIGTAQILLEHDFVPVMCSMNEKNKNTHETQTKQKNAFVKVIDSVFGSIPEKRCCKCVILIVLRHGSHKMDIFGIL